MFYRLKFLVYLLFLIIILSFLLGSNMSSCEGSENLPIVLEFNNLHLTETLKNARVTLKDVSGIYCIINQETGSIYIGSSANLWIRLCDHLTDNNSNLYLQRAILKYGLPAFTFKIIEFCTKELLLEREQHWLDWLFSLPKNLRYNFLS